MLPGRRLKLIELLAVKGLSRFLPGDTAKKAARKSFAKKLVELRGVPLKISQILSMSRDAESAAVQKEALADLEPIPAGEVAFLLKDRCPELAKEIEEFSEFGLPASLGQVHELKMKTGETRAVKLRYPGIEKQMNLDSSLMGLVTKSFDKFREGFSLQDYQSVIRGELLDEMNYLRETEMQERMSQSLREENRIIIPKVYTEHCGEAHLLMDWEESSPVDEWLTESTETRKDAVDLLTRFFFRAVFDCGLLHADPNPGNFGWRRHDASSLELVVYDYGSVVPFPRQHALSLLALMKIAERGQGDPFPWFVKLGFDPKRLAPLQSKLLPFVSLLFEPFLSKSRYDLKEWRRKERAKDILGEERWNFMIAAPASLLLFMRAIIGLMHYATKLDAGFFARPLVDDLLRIHGNEIQQLENSTPPTFPTAERDSMAKHLHVRVQENGKDKVFLSFPRSAIEYLDEIMTNDLRQRIREQGIDVEDIVRKSRERGYRPMNLFSVERGSKSVSVFLS